MAVEEEIAGTQNIKSVFVRGQQADDHESDRGGDAGEEAAQRGNGNAEPANNNGENAQQGSCHSALVGALLPNDTADKGDKAGGSQEGVEGVEQAQDAVGTQRKGHANDHEENIDEQGDLGQLLLAQVLLHGVLNDVLGDNGRHGNESSQWWT